MLIRGHRSTSIRIIFIFISLYSLRYVEFDVIIVLLK